MTMLTMTLDAPELLASCDSSAKPVIPSLKLIKVEHDETIWVHKLVSLLIFLPLSSLGLTVPWSWAQIEILVSFNEFVWMCFQLWWTCTLWSWLCCSSYHHLPEKTCHTHPNICYDEVTVGYPHPEMNNQYMTGAKTEQMSEPKSQCIIYTSCPCIRITCRS